MQDPIETTDEVQLEVEQFGAMPQHCATNSDDVSTRQPESAEDSYRLVRDRAKRQVKAPQRYGYADLIAYALSVELEANSADPANYR